LQTVLVREAEMDAAVKATDSRYCAERILTVPPTGGWKAARTRTLESVRYVAQPFQAAG